jgi:signal transduction histidine kinase/CheY-like chemotaxis protein
MVGKTAIEPEWKFIREDGSPLPIEEYPVNRVVATRTKSVDQVIGVYRPITNDQVWGQISAFPEFDASGCLIQIVVTFVDITQRKLAEEELIKAKVKAEESDRLKSAFLTNMSHEIRTPMNGILGFAELLKEPDLTGDQQQNYIAMINKSGQRMLNIINDIIDISKIEAGLSEVHLSASNINEQLEYIHNFFWPEADLKGLELSLNNRLECNDALLFTDREKVYAILTNLVKNAIKYTHVGGIELGCVRKGDFLEIYVNDTGIGIPKNRQNAIFERFIQADIEDRMAIQGAGLGLAISKAYVEMLGGDIWVESEVGKGSTFYFTLPCVTALESKKNASLSQESRSTGKISELKTLIVEDDESSELLLRSILGAYSKEVMVSHTGTGAIEMCRNHPDLDLIMMDFQLPHMSGDDATKQIRAFNKEVIIIAQTAYGLAGDREKALAAGCNDYLAKPISKIKLQALLQTYFKDGLETHS